ncbi:response regulator transcription factor [Cryomorphaceae bacterium]|nr:response regulator transcription factor [Cryomorphaceae bacterium]
MSESLRLWIVDDQPRQRQVLREKLSFFSGLEVLGESSDGRQALRDLEGLDIDVVLMDLEMPHMNGVEATLRLKSSGFVGRVLIVTVLEDDDSVFQAIRAGADGYVLKDIHPQKLKEALDELAEGGAPMSPTIAAKALRLLRTGVVEAPVEEEEVSISKREQEVLEQLALGKVYSDIAESLTISPYTVRKHIENIYGKLQVHNKVEAVAYAKRVGII